MFQDTRGEGPPQVQRKYARRNPRPAKLDSLGVTCHSSNNQEASPTSNQPPSPNTNQPASPTTNDHTTPATPRNALNACTSTTVLHPFPDRDGPSRLLQPGFMRRRLMEATAFGRENFTRPSTSNGVLHGVSTMGASNRPHTSGAVQFGARMHAQDAFTAQDQEETFASHGVFDVRRESHEDAGQESERGLEGPSGGGFVGQSEGTLDRQPKGLETELNEPSNQLLAPGFSKCCTLDESALVKLLARNSVKRTIARALQSKIPSLR